VSASKISGSQSEDVENGLRAEVASLKDELAERDIIIRNLEIQVEKLKVAQRRAQEAFASV